MRVSVRTTRFARIDLPSETHTVRLPTFALRAKRLQHRRIARRPGLHVAEPHAQRFQYLHTGEVEVAPEPTPHVLRFASKPPRAEPIAQMWRISAGKVQ